MWISTKEKALIRAIVVFAFGPVFMLAQASENLGIEHVVVIGFDGLSPDGLQNSETPIFDSLKNEGAYTLHARAVLPTSSSPNWASMIMGAGPEQHGITSNAWERDNFTLPAITQGDDFLFPTIFRLMDEQNKDVEVGIIYDWGGFGRLFEKNTVDFEKNTENEEVTAEVASEYIIEKKPDLTFIHFDHVDHAGHEFGHGTAEYYVSVEKADELLGQIIEAIEAAGIVDNTLVIVSSDHGGLGKGHGGESLQEIEIPFMLWGKSVKKNHKITHPVYQYDNAATVAYAFGLKAPIAWIGKPVKSAFDGYNLEDVYPILEQFEPPIILPKSEGYKRAGGVFDDSTLVDIKNSIEDGVVRYTLNGSMPSKNSPMVRDSIPIYKNTVVKSAIFKEGKIRSGATEAYFRIKSKNTAKPVNYDIFYLKDLRFVPALENRKPDVSGSCYEITSAEIEGLIKGNTAVRFKTQIQIDETGMYQFYTRSDDGSKLFIDNQVVVDNDGDHGVREMNGMLELAPGKHRLEVLWFNGGGDGWLDVYVEADSMPKQILPTTLLSTK